MGHLNIHDGQFTLKLAFQGELKYSNNGKPRWTYYIKYRNRNKEGSAWVDDANERNGHIRLKAFKQTAESLAELPVGTLIRLDSAKLSFPAGFRQGDSGDFAQGGFYFTDLELIIFGYTVLEQPTGETPVAKAAPAKAAASTAKSAPPATKSLDEEFPEELPGGRSW